MFDTIERPTLEYDAMEACLSLSSFVHSQSSELGAKVQCRTRVLIISEKEYLHIAGNTLRVSPLPQPENNGDYEISSNYSHGIDKDDRDDVFATAKMQRGFSCMAFNSMKGRVAYSPRNVSPSIILKTLRRQLICEIKGGAAIEYEDLCFSRNGTRLAAIGRGKIDSKLFLWDLSTHDQQGTSPILILTHSFNQPLSKVLFDPSNQNQIAIQTSDGKAVIRCIISKLIDDDYKIGKLDQLSPCDTIDKDAHITSMTWETEGRLILGLEDGTILIFQDTILSDSYRIKNEVIGNESIIDLIVTSEYMVIGIRSGKIFWFHRLKDLKQIMNSNPVFVSDIEDEISSIVTSPEYDIIVAHSAKEGTMHSFRILDGGEGRDEHLLQDLRQFSSGVVTAMGCVVLTGKAAYSVLVSGSSDGTIKVWKDCPAHSGKDFSKGTKDLLGSVNVGVPITSIEPLIGYPVFAVGFADSSIKFFYVGKKKDSKITSTELNRSVEVELTCLKTELLNVSPVTHLVFDKKAKKLAAGCFDSGEIFILCTEPSNLHVIGVLETPNTGKLESILWSPSNSYHLLVGTSTASLLQFDTTSLCFTPEPLKPIRVQKLSSTPRGLISNNYTSDTEETNMIFCCNNTSAVDFYDIELSSCDTTAVERVSKYNLIECSGALTIGIIININDHIVIGTSIGEIQVIEPDGENMRVRVLSRSHCSSVLNLCMSSDRSRLYTSSFDGSVFVNPFFGQKLAIPRSAYDYDYLLPTPSMKKMKIDSRRENGKRSTWLNRSADQLLKKLETRSLKSKHEILRRHDDLETRIEDVMSQHGYSFAQTDTMSHEIITKLIIDKSSDKRKRNEIEMKLNRYRGDKESQICTDETAVALFSKRYVDSMECPLRKLYELSDMKRLSIYSFPLRLLSEKEKRRNYCMKILRLNEIEDMKQTSTDKSKSNDGDSVNSILFKSRASKQEGCDLKRSTEIKDLLYPVHLLRSNFRRKIQMHLLDLASRDEVKEFDSAFTKLEEEQKSFSRFLSSAMSKIKKISEKVDVDPAAYLQEANYGVLFRTEIDEVSSCPHRIILSDFGIENEDSDGDAVSKDLGDQKEEASEDEFIQKQMNEVRRLTAAVDDLSISFNQNLTSLYDKRMRVQETLLYNDLNILLIAESISMSKSSVDCEVVQRQILKAERLYERTKHHLDIVQTDSKRLQAIQQKTANEIKEMDRAFRSKIQNSSGDPLDQETVNLLYQMYQRRDFGSMESTKQRNSSKKKVRNTKTSKPSTSTINRRSLLGRQSGRESISSTSNKARPSIVVERRSKDTRTMDFGSSFLTNIELAKKEAELSFYHHDFIADKDPFIEVEDGKTVSTSCSMKVDVVPTVDDIPEGFVISTEVWETMLRLREEMIVKERALAKETKNLDESRHILNTQQDEEKHSYETLISLTEKYRNFEAESLERLQYTDFVMSVYEGQDETEQGAVATDYSDALFLPSSAIERANDRILALAEERLKILHKIKSFRRKINKMTFLNEVLQLRNHDAKELLTDIHLLRLTSELKNMLNGKVENAGEIERQTELQFSRLHQTHAAKIEKIVNEKEKYLKSIQKWKKENKKLNEQLKRVSERRKEQKNLRVESTAIDHRMLNIMKRSKIVEKIKSQSHEIAKLRRDLDTLRQKTFPSFSN